MKVHVRAVAITGAIVAALLYVGGALLNHALAWGTPALVSYVFHVDVIELSHAFTWDSFLIGTLLCAFTGAVIGTVTGIVYNAVTGWLNAPARVKSRVAPAPAA